MQITFRSKTIRSSLTVAILVATLLFSASCKNMFTELADEKSDSAVFYQAQRQSDQKLYGNAIALILSMSSSYQSRRDVKVFLASAYAGRCGLDYIALADAMINNPSNLAPMKLALLQMKSSTSEVDCQAAESLLRGISPNADGIMSDNIDDAFLMTFIGLAKIGAILERVGDANKDGVINVGFDGCTIGAADAREIGTGLTLLYNNINSTGSQIASKLAGMSAVCAPGGVPNPTCAITNPASFSAADLKKILGVVNYATFGVGTDVAYTVCP